MASQPHDKSNFQLFFFCSWDTSGCILHALLAVTQEDGEATNGHSIRRKREIHILNAPNRCTHCRTEPIAARLCAARRARCYVYTPTLEWTSCPEKNALTDSGCKAGLTISQQGVPPHQLLRGFVQPCTKSTAPLERLVAVAGLGLWSCWRTTPRVKKINLKTPSSIRPAK